MKTIRPSAGTTSVVGAQSVFVDAACVRYLEDSEVRQHRGIIMDSGSAAYFYPGVRSGQLSWTLYETQEAPGPASESDSSPV